MRYLKSAWIPAIFKKTFLCFILFCWVFFGARLLGAENTSVELASISGPVEVLISDADDYVDAQEGMILEAHDKVRTREGGAAEISFNEQNTNMVKLEADTQTEILLQDSEKIEVVLGEVFASIADLPGESAFEIRTPTAVSGARGTDWVTKVDEEGTEVEAVENDSYVKEIQSDGSVAPEAVVVKTGYATTVRPFQRPLPLRAMPQERLRRCQEVKGLVRERAAAAFARRQERPPFKREDFIKGLREKRPELFKGRGVAGQMKALRSDDKAQKFHSEDKAQKFHSEDKAQKFRSEDKERKFPPDGKAPVLRPGAGEDKAAVRQQQKKSDNIRESDKNVARPLGQAKSGAAPTKPKNLQTTGPRR